MTKEQFDKAHAITKKLRDHETDLDRVQNYKLRSITITLDGRNPTVYLPDTIEDIAWEFIKEKLTEYLTSNITKLEEQLKAI